MSMWILRRYVIKCDFSPVNMFQVSLTLSLVPIHGQESLNGTGVLAL